MGSSTNEANLSLKDWVLEDCDRRPAARKHEIMADVIAALAALHREGTCHGNLSLATIGLAQTPAVGVANRLPRPPGVHARIAALPADGSDLPESDADLYRAPDASNADPDPASADIFALGIIWYQLLLDRLERPPYDFADVLRAAGHDSHTIGMIARCLAGPGRRFANAVELEQEFAGAAPPQWPPVPKGCVDVSQIVREYLTATSG